MVLEFLKLLLQQVCSGMFTVSQHLNGLVVNIPVPHVPFTFAIEAFDLVELLVELVEERALNRSQLRQQLHKR